MRCAYCGTDFQKESNVSREYSSFKRQESICLLGHYDKEGYFESDEGGLHDTSFNLYEDSDTCGGCHKLVKFAPNSITFIRGLP